MRIAVTGPTGAIGSDLIRLALSKGHDVVAIARPEYSKISADCNCDIFFHLAWMETFGGKRDDVDVQCDNIRYSLDAVKLAHSWGSKVFVGTGSQAEYGPCSMKLGTPGFSSPMEFISPPVISIMRSPLLPGFGSRVRPLLLTPPRRSTSKNPL